MSERISRASENYDRVVSEEGLPGIENDGPPDELWGSGFEKGSGVHKRIEEDLPPEKLATLPSVAEQFAIESGLLDETTGRFNEDKVLAAIKKLPLKEQKKAREALYSVINEYIKEDYKSTGPDIKRKGKSIIRTIAPNITVENERPYYERPKPKKTEVRVTSPEDIDIWLELKQWGNVKNAYLYMDLKTWEDIDKVQQVIKEKKEKLAQEKDEEKKEVLSLGIEDVSEKLHLNKISLEKKGIIRPFVFRQDKKGRDILFSEKAIHAWVDAQKKIAAGEKASTEAVFSVKSPDDLKEVRQIIENISAQTNSLPPAEKEKQLAILNKLEDAYQRADYFINRTGEKKTPVSKTAPEKPQSQQTKKPGPENRPFLFRKDEKGRDIIFTEKALYAWIKAQEKALAGEKTSADAVFFVRSQADLDGLREIIENISDQVDSLANPKEKELRLKILEKIEDAYTRAAYFIKSKEQKSKSTAKKSPKSPQVKKPEREKQTYRFLKDKKDRAIIDNEQALFAWIEEQNKIASKGETPERLVFRIQSPEGLREVELLLNDLSNRIDKISDSQRQSRERVVYNRVAAAYRSAREYLKRFDQGQQQKRDYQGSQPQKVKTKPLSRTETKK